MSRKILALTFMVLVATFSILSTPIVVRADITESDVLSTIVAAQDKLVICYQAVLDASNAGADVTGLILILNQAGENLSRANLAYKMGNFSSAQSYANQSLNLLDQNNIKSQADALRDQASQAGFWAFVINVVGPLVGAAAVIVVGFVLWVVLKKRYTKSEGDAAV